MARPARKYKYRVGVNEYIANADGFGGNVATQSTLLATVWADVQIIPTDKLVDFGLDEAQRGIRILLRKGTIDYFRSDIAFDYAGDTYCPNQVSEITPGVEFQIVASSIE